MTNTKICEAEIITYRINPDMGGMRDKKRHDNAQHGQFLFIARHHVQDKIMNHNNDRQGHDA